MRKYHASLQSSMSVPRASSASIRTDTPIRREVIFTEDVERIFGPRQWVSRTEELFGSGKKERSGISTPPPIDDVEAEDITPEKQPETESSKQLSSQKDSAETPEKDNKE